MSSWRHDISHFKLRHHWKYLLTIVPILLSSIQVGLSNSLLSVIQTTPEFTGVLSLNSLKPPSLMY